MLNLKPYTSQEFKRLYHGRGEKTYPFLTIDSIEDSILIEFYEKKEETPFINYLKNYISKTHHKNIILKRRYKNETLAIVGKIPNKIFAIENKIKFKLNLFNQNIGYFGDIKPLRSYIEQISKNKTVLNLFSYTCGFSMFSRRGGAKRIVNIDMNKSVLKTGLINHQINNLSTKNISFLQHNALKSNYKKLLYDIIIIDPPSFQKGGFDINKDYEKLIKKTTKHLKEGGILFATINSPKYDYEFLKNIVEKNSYLKMKKIIPPNKDYINSTLKIIEFGE